MNNRCYKGFQSSHIHNAVSLIQQVLEEVWQMKYTALTNSTSSGKLKVPATKDLIATSHTCDDENDPCCIFILKPYSSQFRD